jgi:hypothetical protein
MTLLLWPPLTLLGLATRWCGAIVLFVLTLLVAGTTSGSATAAPTCLGAFWGVVVTCGGVLLAGTTT